MFIAFMFFSYPAPLGAECKFERPTHYIALRWSAQVLGCKAINILVLRSKSQTSWSTGAKAKQLGPPEQKSNILVFWRKGLGLEKMTSGKPD